MVAQKRAAKYVEMRAGASGIAMPRIKGSRIRVSILAGHYQDSIADGLSHVQAIDALLESYPTLNRDEIEGGIEYWRAHREEIEGEIRQDEIMDRALEVQQQSLLHHSR